MDTESFRIAIPSDTQTNEAMISSILIVTVPSNRWSTLMEKSFERANKSWTLRNHTWALKVDKPVKTGDLVCMVPTGKSTEVTHFGRVFQVFEESEDEGIFPQLFPGNEYPDVNPLQLADFIFDTADDTQLRSATSTTVHYSTIITFENVNPLPEGWTNKVLHKRLYERDRITRNSQLKPGSKLIQPGHFWGFTRIERNSEKVDKNAFDALVATMQAPLVDIPVDQGHVNGHEYAVPPSVSESPAVGYLDAKRLVRPLRSRDSRFDFRKARVRVLYEAVAQAILWSAADLLPNEKEQQITSLGGDKRYVDLLHRRLTPMLYVEVKLARVMRNVIGQLTWLKQVLEEMKTVGRYQAAIVFVTKQEVQACKEAWKLLVSWLATQASGSEQPMMTAKAFLLLCDIDARGYPVHDKTTLWELDAVSLAIGNQVLPMVSVENQVACNSLGGALVWSENAPTVAFNEEANAGRELMDMDEDEDKDDSGDPDYI